MPNAEHVPPFKGVGRHRLPFLRKTQRGGSSRPCGFASHFFFFFGPDTVQSTRGNWGRTGAGGGGGLASRMSLQMSSAG